MHTAAPVVGCFRKTQFKGKPMRLNLWKNSPPKLCLKASFWEGLHVIVPRSASSALEHDPSHPNWGQRIHYQIRLARETSSLQWVSLNTAKISINVIPLQSAGTLWKKMEKAEKKVPYSPFLSMQRARGAKSVESATRADSFSALPNLQKRTKD